MTKRLYLMRHGETRFNVQKRIQGASDSPLTELGIEQAKMARKFFENQGIKFDRIYSSTQERACDTAEIVSGRRDYIRLKGLKEWDFGAFEAQSEYLNPPLDLEHIGTAYGDYFVTYGGEGARQVRHRMIMTVEEIISQATEGETILAVTHGAAISQYFREVLAVYPDNLTTPNCSIFNFIFDGGKVSMPLVYDPINDKILYKEED
ncbi:histidine phosphatase family protein [Streptococcus oricebi]|uniref:Histidine phosphatase family protein n=1 Tax=Streptococcus oricebi TaxID=1547447 RepID=A0ABS5B4W4_9STRE|nr:histidine phosphatase family protein [Streptococcus oricebi]MBP2623882.1 histidine phosphatase family protein [Streptococcus oricebi]